MKYCRIFAFAAMMAAGVLQGMARNSEEKVCKVNGDLNGWPAQRVTITRMGDDARFYGESIPVSNGRFSYELEADGSTVYSIDAWNGGKGLYADFIAEGGTVNIVFHPDSVAEVRSEQPLNSEVQRVVAATAAMTDTAFLWSGILEKAGLDYTETARRLIKLRESVKDRDSLNVIDGGLRRLHAEGRLRTPEFVEAQKAIGEAYRRMFKVRCDYAVKNPGPVGLYFLQKAAESGLADTAQIRKAVTEIYVPEYPTAYSTLWLQGWLEGCNTAVGKSYFDFTAPDLSGVDHTLSKEIAGRVALIDLWGSWCASCRRHSKELIPVYNKYKDKGFTIVGVAREYDDAEAMEKAIQRDGYPWLNLLELDDRLGLWTKYGVGMAGGARFLVGRDGKILAINPNAAQVEAILGKAL